MCSDCDAPGKDVDRALIYSWMVDLAICFDALNNFNGKLVNTTTSAIFQASEVIRLFTPGVMAITAGLQQTCITRLKNTMNLVSTETKNSFFKLQKLMAVNKNYQTYRNELSSRLVSMEEEDACSIEAAISKAKSDHFKMQTGSIFESWGITFDEDQGMSLTEVLGSFEPDRGVF